MTVRTHKLGQWMATAVCGNDILSSALYVSGIAALFAGVYAPIVLLGIALVLLFYRAVYREVVGALPINGGVYNALLNGTSKTLAAVAGVMTLLSYMATAVISAKIGVEYLVRFLEEFGAISGVIIPGVILVLLAFALLVIGGVRDSAKVALFIFLFHIATLTIFALLGLLRLGQGTGIFLGNMVATSKIVAEHGGLVRTMFLAFSASLLGISGFESSANFVEEQKRGVFRKTLRNMLIGVAIFNPLIALVVLNILPLSAIATAKDFLLFDAAYSLGGLFLAGIVAVDAFLVLSGAVLTSFIGVSGLLHRMTLDDCLPSILLQENKRGAHPRIVMVFFLLCMSVLLLTGGELLSLAGVYTISFLGVMSLFALGNMILRQTRTELKRPYRAPFLFVVLAFAATAFGVVGNSLIDPMNMVFFLVYFIPVVVVVLLDIYKSEVVGMVMKLVQPAGWLYRRVEAYYRHTIDDRFYVFLHHKNRLYGALDYISRNESGWNITFVHCLDKDERGERQRIEEIMPVLHEAGVYPHFNLEFVYLNEPFSPELVQRFAGEHKIGANKIFVGSIHRYHKFDYEDFGGVRIIFS